MENDYLSMLYDLFNIPVTVWYGDDFFQIPSNKEFSSPIFTDEELKKIIENLLRETDIPIIYLDNKNFFYGVYRSLDKRYFCFGPASRAKISKMVQEEYIRKHNVKISFSVGVSGLSQMSKILALSFLQSDQKTVKYSDILIKCDGFMDTWQSEGNFEKYMIAQSEYNREHRVGMMFENQFLEIVKQGDVEGMKEVLSGELPEMEDIGEVSENSIRQAEYMLVVLVTLITRAAIEGGMNVEAAYSLGDVFMRKINECKNDTGALTMLGLKAQIEFTEKVKKAKEERTQFIYVEKCKDYVAKNLRRNFQVCDIAPALGISRTYLTQKFSETEGITIQQYIMKKRCEHAANLLKYSDYPISVISEYFCFSSQSHFGSCFKKIYGMTPKEFRILYTH